MDRIGRYKIIKSLGQQAEAQSFQVWDDEKTSLVLLRKILTPDLEAVEHREEYDTTIRRLYRHDKDHTAASFGFEEIDHQLYLAREYVEGRSLAEVIEDEPYGSLSFFNIAIQITRSLLIAHEHGVIHGRLTSSNLIISQRGCLKLTEQALPADYTQAKNSQFIPPELRAGGLPDEHSDMFSLGVIFYQMLTNQLPFGTETGTGAGSPELDLEVDFHSPPSASIPEDIRLLIEKLLSRDPLDRGQAQICLASLEAMLATRLPSAIVSHEEERPPESKISPRTCVALSALSALLIILWLVVANLVQQ